jgi:hypothetical protein
MNMYGQEATLFLVRPDNYAGKLIDLKVIFNKTEIGKIANKSQLKYKTNFTGDAKIELKAIGSPAKSISINISSGKSYYFLVGFTAMGKYIKQVQYTDVKNEINKETDVVIENPENIVYNKDKKPPVIKLIKPNVSRGFKLSVETDQVKLIGQVTDESGVFRIFVNNNSIPFDEKGNFEYLLALNPGYNKVTIKSTDSQDNTSEFIFQVESKVQTQISQEKIKPEEKRIALIIGNADYKGAPLRNPVNDANLMTTELKKLGFQVNTIKNGSQNQMKQAISNFGESLAKDKNTVGLFYYAGHGLQIKGKNYLVPTDAKIEKEPDVEVFCVDLDGLLANLEYSGNNMNIIILDACRNNPFGRGFRSQASNGLATVNAPVGTIIAYATAPGSVAADGDGKNGLYTQEFVKALSIPNIKIEDVFKKVRTQVKTISEGKQIPWENSSIEGDFYFIRYK